MFIELIDTLRCPEEHRDSWLVASITAREDRLVSEGMLGCPVCGREYPIQRGVAWFGAEPGEALEGRAAPSEMDGGAMRVGAFLAVVEGATIALEGSWGAYASELAQLVPLRIFAVNAPTAVEDSERVASIETRLGLPLAPRALRGVALGEHATETTLPSALRVLADGGRVVAPATLAVPPEVAEIARDEQWWIGEKRGALIGLRRA